MTSVPQSEGLFINFIALLKSLKLTERFRTPGGGVVSQMKGGCGDVLRLF